MAIPGFGFSFGDFTAGVKLVKDLIIALNDSVGAKLQYRRLISELISLERALTEVRHLQVEDSQASQKIALEQAALQCQESIEDFLRRNAKFKTSLGAHTTFSKWSWRTNLHKIQWALCEEDAVNKLRAEITGHTLTINTLLTTIHLSATALQTELAKSYQLETKEHRKVTDEAQSLVKRNHDLLNTQADLILTISRNVTTCSTHQQTEELRLIMLKVLATNMKIYQMVLDIQKLQFQVPAQVDRQLPISFEDAHGRIAPFHIEFINSFEAFQAVMEVRFRYVPGLKKVRNIEYAIHESSSKRKLDLTAPWDSIFLPGRKVNMSMVFRRPQTSMSSCPGCQAENDIDGSNEGSEIQCSNVDCKMWYQRIIEMNEPQEDPIAAPKIQLGKRSRKATLASSRKRSKWPVVEGANYDAEEAAEDDDGDEDEIQQFRRVHVVHNHLVPVSPLRHVQCDHSVPMSFNVEQNSGYWTVPEQTDFLALLRYFGTDWYGIARHMTSKTHIMVYATVFQQWLTIPSDSNKSRRLSGTQTQVKNYYQRHATSDEMSSWEQIANEADEKIGRGESTGPVPTPTILPKRPFRGLQNSVSCSESSIDGIDNIQPALQNSVMQQASSPQPTLSTRFPALTQTGPVPQTMVSSTTSAFLLAKHMPQQSGQQAPQQMQQQIRVHPGPSQRPIMQVSQAEKERKKDIQRKRREKSVARNIEQEETALAKAQAVEDEAERQKFIREAQKAKIMLARGDKSPETRAAPLEPNFLSGIMPTPTAADAEVPKKLKRGGARPRKSKEQKQAEKDCAEAAQAAIDAGEKPPPLEYFTSAYISLVTANFPPQSPISPPHP